MPDLLNALDDSEKPISINAQVVIKYLAESDGLRAVDEWYKEQKSKGKEYVVPRLPFGVTSGVRCLTLVKVKKEISAMADQKDKAQEKKRQEDSGSSDQNEDQAGGSGGNMGAGKSGKEGMGSEKPSDEEGMGSQKPGGSSSQ